MNSTRPRALGSCPEKFKEFRKEIEMRKVLAIAALGLAGFFSVAACGGGSPTPPPSPTSPASPTSPDASVYPASAQNSILINCGQNTGAPASYCQCNLSWLEANVPYSVFVQDPATFEQQADSYASC